MDRKLQFSFIRIFVKSIVSYDENTERQWVQFGHPVRVPRRGFTSAVWWKTSTLTAEKQSRMLEMLNWKYWWEVLFSTLQNWKHSRTKLPSAHPQPAQIQSPLQSGQREDRRERGDKHPQSEKKQALYFWGQGYIYLELKVENQGSIF